MMRNEVTCRSSPSHTISTIISNEDSVYNTMKALKKNHLWKFSFLSGALLLSSASLLAQQTAQEDSSKAQAIFRQALEAAGGTDAFRKIENFRITTQNQVFGERTVMQLTVTETAVLPDKTRQVMEVSEGTRIQVLNGNRSWKKIGQQIRDLSDSEKREMQRGLFRDLINVFKNYETLNLSIQYFGEEKVGNRRHHVLHLKNETGDFFNLYIDPDSQLVAKKTYQGTSAVGFARLEERYSDYRAVDGIKIPFRTIVRARGKKFIESRVTKAELNVELSEDFFLRE